MKTIADAIDDGLLDEFHNASEVLLSELTYEGVITSFVFKGNVSEEDRKSLLT